MLIPNSLAWRAFCTRSAPISRRTFDPHRSLGTAAGESHAGRVRDQARGAPRIIRTAGRTGRRVYRDRRNRRPGYRRADDESFQRSGRTNRAKPLRARAIEAAPGPAGVEEICNKIAANFKLKLGSLGERCELSAPVVVTGKRRAMPRRRRQRIAACLGGLSGATSIDHARDRIAESKCWASFRQAAGWDTLIEVC